MQLHFYLHVGYSVCFTKARTNLLTGFAAEQKERVEAEKRVGRREKEMGVLTNRVERNEIKAGDHIYTYRAVFAYSHHGISFSIFWLWVIC